MAIFPTRQLGKHYPAGVRIFQQESLAKSMYIVQSGRVELVSTNGGRTKKMADVGPGELFGETALFTADKRRTTSARMVEEGYLIRMDAHTLFQQFHSNPSVAFRIVQHMAQKIHDLDSERERWLEMARSMRHGLDLQPRGEIRNQGDYHSTEPDDGRQLLNVHDFSVRHHILLVEDDPDFIALVKNWLKKAETENEQDEVSFSHALNVAESLGSALNLLQENKYDVILMDLNLPDSRGLSSFVSLYQRYPETPIIILSGTDNASWSRRAVHCGAQDFLVKNRTNSEMLKRVLQFAVERQRFRFPVVSANDFCAVSGFNPEYRHSKMHRLRSWMASRWSPCLARVVTPFNSP
ncbi:MAG: response regulator [Magnetococcales bacterium]|nr:response regulator [Magnetococcales bacterium]